VINAFNDADQMQVAIDFMKWWYSKETQTEFAKRGGNPADKATLDAPGFDDLQPHFHAYRYMLEGNSRDFWHDPNYSEMLAAQQEGGLQRLHHRRGRRSDAGAQVRCLQTAADPLRRRTDRRRTVG
jgi:ABC-type glycerol-3-phosphate transport system substrate-binding protein